MKWARAVMAALIVGSLAIVGVTLWQITTAPLPVPHVRVIKVPVPGPSQTVVNRYYTVPAPQSPVTSLPSRVLPTGTTTTTRPAPAPTTTTTTPRPPCTPVVVAHIETCLP